MRSPIQTPAGFPPSGVSEKADRRYSEPDNIGPLSLCLKDDCTALLQHRCLVRTSDNRTRKRDKKSYDGHTLLLSERAGSVRHRSACVSISPGKSAKC